MKKLTIHEAMKVIKETSPQEFLTMHIDAIKASNLNAFITVCEDVKQRIIHINSSNPLAFIPMGVKDIYCTKGVRTTAASLMLENFIPEYESTVTSRLNNAGAICVGKTNMDEFAMGASGKHSAFGSTINPIKINGSSENLIPGGSSSGSAAAVAAGLCTFALGTDTGGSIRQPASFCGVVGFKPSYGMLSRYGIVAFASSLDQAGFFTNCVEDVALLLSLTVGPDGKDSTLFNKDYKGLQLTGDLKGKKIGIPQEFLLDEIHPEIIKTWDDAKIALESAGAKVVPVSLPHAQYSIQVYYFLCTSEASSNLARYDGIKYGKSIASPKNIEDLIISSRTAGFGKEVKNRIMIGTHNLLSENYSKNYEQVLKVRRLIKNEFNSVFSEVDAILCPSTPNLALKMNETQTKVEEYANDILTVPVNIAGLCGISIPMCNAKDGRPIGMQLIGNSGNDAELLDIALGFERAIN